MHRSVVVVSQFVRRIAARLARGAGSRQVLSVLLAFAALAGLRTPSAAQLRIIDVLADPDLPWQDVVAPLDVGNEMIGFKSVRPPGLRNKSELARIADDSDVAEVEGYSADGVTVLLLAYKAPEPGCVEFIIQDEFSAVGEPAGEASVGKLRDHFDQKRTGNKLVIPTEQISYPVGPFGWFSSNAKHWAFAELRAPIDFVRDGVAPDLGLYKRQVTIEATFHKLVKCGDPNDQGTSKIEHVFLYRPPLLLVHGVFSNASMWDAGDWNAVLSSTGPFKQNLTRVDYSREISHWTAYQMGLDFPFLQWTIQGNAIPLVANRNVMPEAVQDVLRKRRKEGIATTQVDVVAHSMGGLLARFFVQERNILFPGQVAPYARLDNWALGDIHKLITLDTPHEGSPLADRVFCLSASSIATKKAIDSLGKALDMPPFQGAVADMTTDSDALSIAIEDAEVPSHAVVGRGGAQVVASGGSIMENFLEAKELLFFRKFITTTISDFYSSLFGSESHDLVVSASSQEGGLGGQHVTYVDTPMWEGTHMGAGDVPSLCVPPQGPCLIGVPCSDDVATIVRDLLQAKVGGGRFAARFPQDSQDAAAPHDDLRRRLASPPSPYMDEPIEPEPATIVIVRPSAGTLLPGGAQQVVTVEAEPGFTPNYVAVVAGGWMYDAVFQPATGKYKATITIPVASLGALTIYAVATSAAGAAGEHQVVIGTELPAGVSITGLSVEPTAVDHYGDPLGEQLRVRGSYSDGVERTLTSGAVGTLYQSANPSVATVTADGVVHATGKGSTSIQVTHGTQAVLVPVTVHAIPGDSDRDGDVDSADFGAFAACFTGPALDANYATPVSACLSAFDFDADLDIDMDDYASFLLLYSGPPNPDCNGNSADDRSEILAHAVSDCDHDGVPDTCNGKDCNGNGIADACDVTPQTWGFDPPANYASASSSLATSVAAGDFDGDGRVDLAVAHASGGISVLMGNASGGYASAMANAGLPISTTPTALLAVNVDGGTGEELLVLADHATDQTLDKLVVLYGCQGNGLFSGAKVEALSSFSAVPQSSPRGLAVADFNGDTKPDVAITRGSAPAATPAGGKVDVLNNTSTTGNPDFGAATALNAQAGATAIAATDVDKDGDVDLVVGNYSSAAGVSSVLVYKRNGSFPTNPSSIYNAASGFAFDAPVALASGDMNGDGWPEIAVANQGLGTVDLLVNTASTSTPYQHTLLRAIATCSGPLQMVAADLNGDGRTDFAYNGSSAAAIDVFTTECAACAFWGNGAGDQNAYSVPSPARGIAVRDTNGDGRLDVVTANSTTNDVSVRRNHTLLPAFQDRDGNLVPDVCQVDCNANGKLDTCDVVKGVLSDCNQNGLADLCEIQSGAVADCNGNGRPDTCDVDQIYATSSAQLGPIYFGSPQTSVFSAPPAASLGGAQVVRVKVAANAYFAASNHFMNVSLNGHAVGQVYPDSGPWPWGCGSENGPDCDELTITPATFNAWKGAGDVTITLTPGPGIPGECLPPSSPSWVQVTLEYDCSTSLDENENGIPDECAGG